MAYRGINRQNINITNLWAYKLYIKVVHKNATTAATYIFALYSIKTS